MFYVERGSIIKNGVVIVKDYKVTPEGRAMIMAEADKLMRQLIRLNRIQGVKIKVTRDYDGGAFAVNPSIIYSIKSCKITLKEYSKIHRLKGLKVGIILDDSASLVHMWTLHEYLTALTAILKIIPATKYYLVKLSEPFSNITRSENPIRIIDEYFSWVYDACTEKFSDAIKALIRARFLSGDEKKLLLIFTDGIPEAYIYRNREVKHVRDPHAKKSRFWTAEVQRIKRETAYYYTKIPVDAKLFVLIGGGLKLWFQTKDYIKVCRARDFPQAIISFLKERRLL